jgi:hypothetical protein
MNGRWLVSAPVVTASAHRRIMGGTPLAGADQPERAGRIFPHAVGGHKEV